MLLFLTLIILFLSINIYAASQIKGCLYSSGTWEEIGHGNHRAVIEVTDYSDYNKVRIMWRRHDKNFQNVFPVIEDEKGIKIKNYYELNKNREYCDLIFKPTKKGLFYVYYLPVSKKGDRLSPNANYFNEFDSDYIIPNEIIKNPYREFIPAKHIAIEYRETKIHKGFNSFYPMEIIATQEEIALLVDNFAREPQNPIIFLEDAYHPIKMEDYLPYRFIEKGPSKDITLLASPGDCVIFQVGVYAPFCDINNIKIKATDGENIPFTCFNTEGRSHEDGSYFTKEVNIKKGKIKSLWCECSIPKDAQGKYTKHINLWNKDFTEDITINLNITGKPTQDPYKDMFSLSRLDWLNSQIGFDDIVLPPYAPVKVDHNKVSILDREIFLDKSGLPYSIKSRGVEILSAPIEFNVDNDRHPSNETFSLKHLGKSYANFESFASSDNFHRHTQTTLECDGCITVKTSLKAKKDFSAGNITLNIPIKKEIATYLMGYGVQGGYRKCNIDWKWDINKTNQRIWVGETFAGIHLDLKHNYDTWDQYYNYHYGVPSSWDNEGRGGSRVTEKENCVLIQPYTGKMSFKEGEEITWTFQLLITPFHKINPDHWNYTDSYSGALKAGNYAHQHHAADSYHFINYPFFDSENLKKDFDNYNKKFKGINLYYTMRELTCHAPEIFAFESLDGEIYEDGNEVKGKQKDMFLTLFGGKCPWVEEHLFIEPHPEWVSPLKDGETDPAIGTWGCSRLANFYVKGLDYALDILPFDGVYIDSLKYSRITMKRLAKVLYSKKGYARINMHIYNMFHHFDVKNSPASSYMEHFPYVTTLWLGEEANYDLGPDHWLIEHSGIPFGLTSEELNYGNNPNQYKGMIYGMSGKNFENAEDMWNFWKDYNINSTEMIGYWDKNCPVRTDNRLVPATVFVRDGECLTAVASWSDKEEDISLSCDFDYIKAELPTIQGFQSGGNINIDKPIKIPPHGGCLINIKTK